MCPMEWERYEPEWRVVTRRPYWCQEFQVRLRVYTLTVRCLLLPVTAQTELFVLVQNTLLCCVVTHPYSNITSSSASVQSAQ